MSLPDLIPVLQLAIGPMILVSGVGMLLLSMTNRFGRIIDRSRLLTRDYYALDEPARTRTLEQLRILAARARLVRAGIAFGAFSVLLAALLIISLFVAALLQLEIASLIASLFVLCLINLIVSLLLFISDINLSLRALWLEIPPAARQREKN